MSKLDDFLQRFTFEEKRKREFGKFAQEVSRISELSEKEIAFELTEALAEKEYWKSPVVIAKLVILCAALFGAWAGFVSLVKAGVVYTAETGEEVAVVVTFWVGFAVAAGISVIMLYILHEMSRDYRDCVRKVMMLESAARSLPG